MRVEIPSQSARSLSSLVTGLIMMLLHVDMIWFWRSVVPPLGVPMMATEGRASGSSGTNDNVVVFVDVVVL